ARARISTSEDIDLSSATRLEVRSGDDRWVLSPRGQQKLSPGGDRSLLLQLEEGEIPDASLELENLPIRILPAEDGDAARAGDAGQSPGEAGDPSALRLIELTYVPEQNLVGVPGI